MTTQTSNSPLRLAYLTSNDHDTIALIDGERVVSIWDATPEAIGNFRNPGDLGAWDQNMPDCDRVSDHGVEITGEALAARLEAISPAVEEDDDNTPATFSADELRAEHPEGFATALSAWQEAEYWDDDSGNECPALKTEEEFLEATSMLVYTEDGAEA